MRKMTQKATKFLYEKEEKKQGTSLREMAAKKSHEEKIRKARSTGTESSVLELSKRSANVSDLVTESHRSRQISSRKLSTMNVSRKTSRIRISGKTSANSSFNVNNEMTFGTQVRRHQSSKIMDDEGTQPENITFNEVAISAYSKTIRSGNSRTASSDSSELDELKELEMRTGLVATK